MVLPIVLVVIKSTISGEIDGCTIMGRVAAMGKKRAWVMCKHLWRRDEAVGLRQTDGPGDLPRRQVAVQYRHGRRVSVGCRWGAGEPAPEVPQPRQGRGHRPMPLSTVGACAQQGGGHPPRQAAGGGDGGTPILLFG